MAPRSGVAVGRCVYCVYCVYRIMYTYKYKRLLRADRVERVGTGRNPHCSATHSNIPNGVKWAGILKRRSSKCNVFVFSNLFTWASEDEKRQGLSEATDSTGRRSYRTSDFWFLISPGGRDKLTINLFCAAVMFAVRRVMAKTSFQTLLSLSLSRQWCPSGNYSFAAPYCFLSFFFFLPSYLFFFNLRITLYPSSSYMRAAPIAR